MKQYGQKQEISILTLLANEATSDARKLLKKYGKQDAKDYADLEVKLTDLYFGSPDRKLDIEKDMAEIHPHKKWILKYQEKPKEEIKVEEKKVEEKKIEHCNCSDCERARVMSGMKFSSAEGDKIQQPQTKDHTGLYVIGAVSVLAILALALNKKSV